jgi:hypothetical protein
MSSHCNLQEDEKVLQGTPQVGNGALAYYRSKSTKLCKFKHKPEREKNPTKYGLTLHHLLHSPQDHATQIQVQPCEKLKMHN